jgi:hypothetical protein
MVVARYSFNIAHRGFITVIRGESQVELKIHMKVLMRLLCVKPTKRLESTQNI